MNENLASTQVDARGCDTAKVERKQGDIEMFFAFHVLLVDKCARADDTHNFSFDQAFAWLTDLLTDCDFFACLDELVEIVIECVIRHASHGNTAIFAASAARERNIENLGTFFRITQKHLVEVAETIQ